MKTSTTVECKLPLPDRSRPRVFPIPPDTSRVPRLSRLMALAIRMEGLIRGGGIADYSALARLGHVSRARITQIMNLLLLAPDIQEQILFLPPTRQGRDPFHLAQLQPIALSLDWTRQRRLWDTLVQNSMPRDSPDIHVSAKDRKVPATSAWISSAS